MQSLTRRGFLRGIAGSSLALPWLESLVATAPSRAIPLRMAHFYVPIGVVRRGFFPGEADHVIPKGNLGNKMSSLGRQDPDFSVRPLASLTPTMQPLEASKAKVTLITGMDRTFQQGTDVHAQCASCYLSSAKPYTIEGTAWPLDRTLDHLVADEIGKTTPFPTLEFSCNSHKDNRESIYFDNISWYGTGHVAPSIRDPRAMYRRLFSRSESDRYREVTSLVLEDARDLNRQLAAGDRHKFGEYLEAIRSIERKTERLEKMKAELAAVSLEETLQYLKTVGHVGHMLPCLQFGHVVGPLPTLRRTVIGQFSRAVERAVDVQRSLERVAFTAGQTLHGPRLPTVENEHRQGKDIRFQAGVGRDEDVVRIQLEIQ